MKKNTSLKQVLGVSLFAISTASSAGVWAPNDGDINLISINPLGFAFPSLADTFGIFEDTADLSTAAPVLTFDGIGKIAFMQSGSDYTISHAAASGTLLGSSNFQIGFFSQGNWSSEVGNVNLGSDANMLIFSDGGAFENSHFLYGFDITPSRVTDDLPAIVPLPASVWLMGSALLGVIMTGRRKANVLA
jgi:hypothetical protein